MTPKHDKHEQAKWIRELRATDEGRRLLEEERVVFEAMEAIAELMQSQGVSRSQLAERLGKSAAFVTKLFERREQLHPSHAGRCVFRTLGGPSM